MTLIHELDLDIPKMYLHTKNYVPRPRLSKVTASTDRERERETLRQTDRQMRPNALPIVNVRPVV